MFSKSESISEYIKGIPLAAYSLFFKVFMFTILLLCLAKLAMPKSAESNNESSSKLDLGHENIYIHQDCFL